MILFGHRGAKGEAPENTLAGFQYGLNVGLRAFETDVRLTADGEIVLLHDATVDRTTDGTGAVAGMTLEQVRSLDARADFPDWPAPCRVPTLDELLDFLPPDITVEVEIKRDTPERLALLVPRLVEALDRHDARGRVTISSFEADALRRAREAAPEIPRGFIGAYDAPRFLETAVDLECAQADIPLATGSVEMVRAAHDAGLRVTGWPGDTDAQMETLVREWRVEGITTNFPSVALPFLRAADRGD